MRLSLRPAWPAASAAASTPAARKASAAIFGDGIHLKRGRPGRQHEKATQGYMTGQQDAPGASGASTHKIGGSDGLVEQTDQIRHS